MLGILDSQIVDRPARLTNEARCSQGACSQGRAAPLNYRFADPSKQQPVSVELLGRARIVTHARVSDLNVAARDYMDFKQYLRLLRQHWLLIVACTLLATTAAGAVAFLQKPVYAARTQLFVATSTSDPSAGLTQTYQGGLFSQQRVKSYADIVTSPRITEAVRVQLRLSYTTDELRAKISASAPLDTVLINVTVNDHDPALARSIADAVGQQFAGFVQEIETPQGQAKSPVKVSVVQPAQLPTSPVSPRKKLDIALGLVLGLAVGVGAAVLRETLDNTIGSKHDAADVAGAPVLGVIAEDPSARSQPLIVQDGFSARAEAFRQLRTNIRFLSVDQGLAAIVVTSSLEGEGKTTTATNLAIAIAQAGDRVVLIDGDLRRPTLADVLGLSPAVGLTSVLVDETPLAEALQVWRQELPLRVLASGPVPPNPSELLSSHRMAELLETLEKQADVVIFDSPPLLPVTDAAILARITSGAILVTKVGSTRTDQLAAAAEALRAVEAPVLGVVLNRLPRRGKGSSYNQYSYGYGYRPVEGKSSEPGVAGRNGQRPVSDDSAKVPAAASVTQGFTSAPVRSGPRPWSKSARGGPDQD